MKAILTLLVLVGIGWASVYFLGGYANWDPSEQGRKARAAITPGMSVAQVVDIAGEPRKYRPMKKETDDSGGELIEFIVPGPPNTFNLESVEHRLQEGSLPHGLMITYMFSNRVAFSVMFDGNGTVTHTEDAVTMADLLQMSDE